MESYTEDLILLVSATTEQALKVELTSKSMAVLIEKEKLSEDENEKSIGDSEIESRFIGFLERLKITEDMFLKPSIKQLVCQHHEKAVLGRLEEGEIIYDRSFESIEQSIEMMSSN